MCFLAFSLSSKNLESFLDFVVNSILDLFSILLYHVLTIKELAFNYVASTYIIRIFLFISPDCYIWKHQIYEYVSENNVCICHLGVCICYMDVVSKKIELKMLMIAQPNNLEVERGAQFHLNFRMNYFQRWSTF